MYHKNITAILTALSACMALTAAAFAAPRGDEEKSEKSRESGQPEGGIATPTTCSAQKLIDSIGAVGDLMGWTVALDGENLLVGAPWADNGAGDQSGKVIAFQLTPNGVWQQFPGPVPNNPQPGAFFGYGIGLSGDAAAIGAPFHDNFEGAAYFFKRPQGGGWNQVQMVKPLGIVSGDYFGSSAAINETGDIAVIGAPYKDITDDQGTDVDAGEAYIYSRNPDGTWSLEASLYDTDPATRDAHSLFGNRVAISGEVAVIANRSDSYYVIPEAGSVRVYRRNPQHQWNLEATLFAPLPQPNAYFGDSVAIDGNEVIVGAVLEDSNGLTNNGAVHTYRYTNGTWNFDGTITELGGLSQDAFGGQVAISGDRVVITNGDYMQQDSAFKGAFVYHRVGASTWVFEKVLGDPDDNTNGFFGSAVAMDGARFVVGDYIDDPNGINNAGAAYMYTFTSDDCGNAAPIVPGSYTGCTEGLTVQMQNLCGPSAPSGPDAWFSYTAICSGPVTIDTNGSSFDTVLSVHVGCPGDNGLTLACDDDSGIGTASQLTFYPVQGDTYKIRLAGYNGASGPFVLHLTTECSAPEICPADIAPQPSGDGVVNAADLLMVINNWGINAGPADIAPPPNGNGVVNAADLLMVINSWGACP